MKLFIFVVAFVLSVMAAPGSEPPSGIDLKPTQAKTVSSEAEKKKVIKKEVKPKDIKKAVTWRDNPNKCNLDTQWVRADNLKCKDKPKPAPSSAVVSAASVASNLSLNQRERAAAQFYLSQGFTRVATANLLGTIKQESGFVPWGNCGDGGLACGLFQWHPNRRYDMPTDFHAQLEFSIKEMLRDSPETYTVLTTSSSDWEVREAIRSWIRWGHTGARWVYADQYLSTL